MVHLQRFVQCQAICEHICPLSKQCAVLSCIHPLPSDAQIRNAVNSKKNRLDGLDLSFTHIFRPSRFLKCSKYESGYGYHAGSADQVGRLPSGPPIQSAEDKGTESAANLT